MGMYFPGPGTESSAPALATDFGRDERAERTHRGGSTSYAPGPGAGLTRLSELRSARHPKPSPFKKRIRAGR
jgi:hypothetical protein